MIQLTDVFCVLFRYITGSLLSYYNNRLIQLSVIQLSGGDCIASDVPLYDVTFGPGKQDLIRGLKQICKIF